MKVNPDRYDTDVEKTIAEGEVELLASIGSFTFAHGFSLSN